MRLQEPGSYYISILCYASATVWLMLDPLKGSHWIKCVEWQRGVGTRGQQQMELEKRSICLAGYCSPMKQSFFFLPLCFCVLSCGWWNAEMGRLASETKKSPTRKGYLYPTRKGFMLSYVLSLNVIRPCLRRTHL